MRIIEWFGLILYILWLVVMSVHVHFTVVKVSSAYHVDYG
jgi:hypothetical protein